MKRFNVIVLTLLLPVALFAQKDYRVVIDLTSKDTNQHKAVMRWINEITTTEPTAMVEVVMYAQGVHMVSKDKSVVSADIAKYSGNNRVRFVACEVALKNQKLDKSQVLDKVELVPDGIYEIITRQRQHWGYIKAGL